MWISGRLHCSFNSKVERLRTQWGCYQLDKRKNINLRVEEVMLPDCWWGLVGRLLRLVGRKLISLVGGNTMWCKALPHGTCQSHQTQKSTDSSSVALSLFGYRGCIIYTLKKNYSQIFIILAVSDLYFNHIVYQFDLITLMKHVSENMISFHGSLNFS